MLSQRLVRAARQTDQIAALFKNTRIRSWVSAANALGSVTIIVQDFSRIAGREIPRLLPAQRVLKLTDRVRSVRVNLRLRPSF
jgi:hypothetical protein